MPPVSQASPALPPVAPVGPSMCLFLQQTRPCGLWDRGRKRRRSRCSRGPAVRTHRSPCRRVQPRGSLLPSVVTCLAPSWVCGELAPGTGSQAACCHFPVGSVCVPSAGHTLPFPRTGFCAGWAGLSVLLVPFVTVTGIGGHSGQRTTPAIVVTCKAVLLPVQGSGSPLVHVIGYCHRLSPACVPGCDTKVSSAKWSRQKYSSEPHGSSVKFQGVKKPTAWPRGSSQTTRTWRRVWGASWHRREPRSPRSQGVRKPAWLQATRDCGDLSSGELRWVAPGSTQPNPEGPSGTVGSGGVWPGDACAGLSARFAVGLGEGPAPQAHVSVGAGGLGVCCTPLSDSVADPSPQAHKSELGRRKQWSNPGSHSLGYLLVLFVHLFCIFEIL